VLLRCVSFCKLSLFSNRMSIILTFFLIQQISFLNDFFFFGKMIELCSFYSSLPCVLNDIMIAVESRMHS